MQKRERFLAVLETLDNGKPIRESRDIVTGERDVTGERGPLARTLAEHGDAAALWYAEPPEGVAAVERTSAGNLKPTWTDLAPARDWLDERAAQGVRRCRARVPPPRDAGQERWNPHGG